MLIRPDGARLKRKAMEEVAPVKLYYTNERPSTLLAAVCAPSASWLPESAPVAILAADRAPVAQAHQVQIQAELVRTQAGVGGSNGISGFVGSNGTSVEKRMTDGGSGAPPRGRPV